MTTNEDLVNKGFILGPVAQPSARTVIVTGQYRSGTSLVAAMLQQAGLFIGSEINDIVYQDEEFFRPLFAGDTAALPALIASRNATHAKWGFKYPMLWRTLTASQLGWFDAPRLVITFRDPVSVAVRASLSEYREPMHALRDAVNDQVALFGFISELTCPYLLLSYEKALSKPADFIETLLRFCAIPCDDARLTRLLSVIELDRPNYLVSARRRFDGTVEGVHSGHLCGWCALTQVAEPVTLEVFVDGRLAVTLIANAFRQDLQQAGIGDGRHGFVLPLQALQAGAESVIRICVAGHGVELDNSGKRLREYGASA